MAVAPTQEPVRVAGELRIAVRDDIRTLNPYVAQNSSEQFAMSLLYDTLLDQEADGTLRPNLAEGWELARDGSSATFWLNPQARWHDGQSVAAEDVAFSFTFAARHQLPGLAQVITIVDRVEAITPSEVRFTLVALRADALRLLGTQLRIVPARLWDEVDDPLAYPNLDGPIGSGPFLFVAHTPEEQLVLRNARGHHVGYGVDTLVLEILRNDDAGLEALVEGTVDALGWDAAPAIVRAVLDNPDAYGTIRVAEAPSQQLVALLLNLRRAPYDNQALRCALAKALDVQAIIAQVAIGWGDTATAGLFAPNSPWLNPDIAPITVDQPQATKELDAAGFLDRDGDGLREGSDGSPMRIAIACPELPAPTRVAELAAANWQAVGIATEVVAIAQDAIVPTLVRAEFDVVVQTMPTSGPETLYSYFHRSRGVLNNGRVTGLNYSGYANPECDDLIRDCQQELDPSQRQALLNQLQEILAVDLPLIPLYYPDVLSLYRDDRFQGWSAQPDVGLLSRATIANLTVSAD